MENKNQHYKKELKELLNFYPEEIQKLWGEIVNIEQNRICKRKIDEISDKILQMAKNKN